MGQEIIAFHIAGIPFVKRFQDLTLTQKIFIELAYEKYYKNMQKDTNLEEDKYAKAREMARKKVNKYWQE